MACDIFKVVIARLKLDLLSSSISLLSAAATEV